MRVNRSRQPQYAAQLHPEIAAYVRGYMSGALGGKTSEGGKVTLEGSIPINASAVGPAYIGDGADNAAYASLTRAHVLAAGDEFTLVCVMRAGTSSVQTGLPAFTLGSTSGSGGNTLFRVMGGSNANRLDLQVIDSAGVSWQSGSFNPNYLSDMLWRAVVLTVKVDTVANGGEASLYSGGSLMETLPSLQTTGSPAATTFDLMTACATIRGGAATSWGSYDIALLVPIIGRRMPKVWCERASNLAHVWDMVFAPRPGSVSTAPVSAAGGDVTLALSGQAVTASAGTLSLTTSLALSGQAVTASAGTLTSSQALSGQAVTASAGTAAPTLTVALTGQAVTASAGTAAPTLTIALTGQAVTASAGTAAPTLTVALTGQAVTASAGAVTYNASGNITLALSGQAVTASAGTLVPSRTVAQTGQAVTASAGTVAPGISKAAAGEQITTSAGTLTLGIVVQLSGQAVTASAGAVTYNASGATTVALTGSEVTASSGAVTGSRTVALTGSSVAATAGTVIAQTGTFRAGNPRTWIVDSRQRYVQVDASPPNWRV